MSILDSFFGKKTKPRVTWFSINALDAVYSTSLSVFYEFYERNPYVGSVIGRITSDVWAYWYEVRRHKKAQPTADYQKLISASIGYTPRQFVKRIVRDYEVTSNAYVYAPKTKWVIQSLQILDPRYVKPIMNAYGEVLGYVQNLNGIRVFTKDEIFHLRGDTDLRFECVGRSKMESLFVDLETDKEARDSNLAFFRNNQTPASIIVLEDEFSLGETEEEEMQTMKEMKEILETGKYTGWKNRHRASVLQWVKEIIKVQDKISDMEFIELRKFTLDMVCAVYEVPKDILGITETSNRSVGNIQTETYYLRIEEKEQLVDEFMTRIFQEAFGPEYSYVTIKDNVRLLLVRGSLASDLYNKRVINLNEAREIIQYIKVEWGEEFDKKQEPAVTTDPNADVKDTKKKQ